MAEEIILTQTEYSKAIFDNGILIIEKRTGNSIRHKNVPWSAFCGLQTAGNTDSYYEKYIRYRYPVF